MGNGFSGFSEEANAPEKAMRLPVYDTSTVTQGKIAGTWERDKQKRREALDAKMDALRRRRITAPTLAGRQEAASKIQKSILNTAQRRNESRRAASEYIRLGIRNTRTRKTREFAPNAFKNSPLERLQFYLEVPKKEGYYTDRKKLFLALSMITDLPERCDTIFYEDEDEGNKPVTVCDIILNDKHDELSRAIAAIDRRTFMYHFRSISQLYNDCEKKHKSFASQALSTAVTATEEAAAITTNPAEPVIKTFWGWFSGFFTRKRNSPAAPSASAVTSSRSRTNSNSYVPVPSVPLAVSIAGATSASEAAEIAGAYRPRSGPNNAGNISLQPQPSAAGGSRTRKHKRKPRHSK
jgi:hypothetical protein